MPERAGIADIWDAHIRREQIGPCAQYYAPIAGISRITVAVQGRLFAVIGGTEVNEQERRAGEQERASAALRRPRYGSVRPMNARNLCAMGLFPSPCHLLLRIHHRDHSPRYLRTIRVRVRGDSYCVCSYLDSDEHVIDVLCKLGTRLMQVKAKSELVAARREVVWSEDLQGVNRVEWNRVPHSEPTGRAREEWSRHDNIRAKRPSRSRAAAVCWMVPGDCGSSFQISLLWESDTS